MAQKVTVCCKLAQEEVTDEASYACTGRRS